MDMLTRILPGFHALAFFALAAQAGTPMPVFIPENTGFTISQPVLFQDGVAWFAILPDGFTSGSVQYVNSGDTTTIADFGTPYPADLTRNFTAFYNLASDGDALYLVANSQAALGGRYGLFKYNKSGFSTLVADAAELAPGSGFAGISGIRAGGGNAVFHVRQASTNYEAYYLHDGVESILIADTDTTVAENDGVLHELPTVGAGISADGQHIVLRVKTGLAPGVGQPDRYTIYRYVNGELMVALDTGDVLPGGLTVHNITTQPVILNDGTIIASVQVIPSAIRLAVIQPDNEKSLVPEVTNAQGHTVRLGYDTGTNDGEFVYGTASYFEGFAYRGADPVRFDAKGQYMVVATVPFEAAGKNWAPSFAVRDADLRGYIATVNSSDGFSGIFTNIDGLGDGSGGGTTTSLWSEYPDQSGWKTSLALGLLNDVDYPWIQCAALGGWARVHTDGATLEGFVVFAVSSQKWYFANEFLEGWVWRFAGGEQDPGWEKLTFDR